MTKQKRFKPNKDEEKVENKRTIYNKRHYDSSDEVVIYDDEMN